jgi:RNA polymerase sigma-70 factor (ECF subfamily)
MRDDLHLRRVLALTETAPVPARAAAPSPEMVERLIALDAAAWQELFDEYFGKMRSFAYVRTGDLHIAEDIASEVFTAAVRGIGSYQQTGAPFSAWLYRIARNVTADHLRRQRRRPTVSLEGFDLEDGSAGIGADEKTDIARALAKLTLEQQEIIVLRFFNDCSLEETAQAMGKNVGAVKALQQRALGAMRRQLAPRSGR